MRLARPKKDLEIAAKAIEEMKATTDFSELQESWENFLFRLERAWEVTERALRTQKGFQQWHRPYTELRKKDPLLSFLKQARNSTMHSISDTVTKPLKFEIYDKSGRDFSVDKVSSSIENDVLTIDIKTSDILPNLDTRVIPTDPKVVRFKNRGKWFNKPWHHLGKRIEDFHPVSVASLGLTFYRSYIAEAEHWLNSYHV